MIVSKSVLIVGSLVTSIGLPPSQSHKFLSTPGTKRRNFTMSM